MNQLPVKLPLYLKFSQILLAIVALLGLLYVGQDVIVPVLFSLIISILLNPMVNFFHRIGINRVISILICITLLMVFVTGLFIFVGSQMATFSDTWPQLKQKFNLLFADGVDWFSQTFNVSKSKIGVWVTNTRKESMSGAGDMIGQTLVSIGGVFATVFLFPVYIFLFIFYKPLLLHFVAKLFSKEKHKVVVEVLTNIKILIQSYLVGLLIEMAIVATLNSVALLIIGIDSAILLGVIGAILNLIPYIGGIIAIALPMIMGFVTGTPFSALLVLIAYIVIQLIDNNFLVPKIVASKVKVNALVSIIVVLIGGALWGISGMFLSIPLTAIIKVVFDHIRPLEPFGYLIGDTMPPLGQAVFNFHPEQDHKEETEADEIEAESRKQE